MKPIQHIGVFVIVGFCMTSCRLGESLDDFTSGMAATGGHSGNTGGSGGKETDGGGTGGGGGGGGTEGGTGGLHRACETIPSTCSDFGPNTTDRVYGCCHGNFLYYCESLESTWVLRSENCDITAKQCGYSSSAKAMRCVEGTGGDGGNQACSTGECKGQCKDCNGNSYDGCETDTNSNPDHCGECDHSCQGGQCSGGTCQVIVLAPNQKTPWGIAVDENTVYWLSEGTSSDSGTLSSVPIDGGTPQELASKQNGPVQLVEDEDQLFWTNFQGGGAVRRIRKDGTDLMDLSSASGPWALTIGGQYVYWTNTSDGSLRRVQKTGGQSQILLTGESTPRGIATDASFIYWTTSGNGQIRTRKLSSGSPLTLVSNQQYPLAIVVDDQWVYWTELGPNYSQGDCSMADGRVLRAHKTDGSNQVTLVDSQACPMNLVVNKNHLFWVNAGTVTNSNYNHDGTVQRIDIDGSNLKVIASGQNRPYGIAVSEEAVFWTNQGVYTGQGSVMKIAR